MSRSPSNRHAKCDSQVTWHETCFGKNCTKVLTLPGPHARVYPWWTTKWTSRSTSTERARWSRARTNSTPSTGPRSRIPVRGFRWILLRIALLAIWCGLTPAPVETGAHSAWLSTATARLPILTNQHKGTTHEWHNELANLRWRQPRLHHRSHQNSSPKLGEEPLPWHLSNQPRLLEEACETSSTFSVNFLGIFPRDSP